MHLLAIGISGVVPYSLKFATIVIDDVTIKTVLTCSRAEAEFQSTYPNIAYLRRLCSLLGQRVPSSLTSFPGKKYTEVI